LQMLNNDFLLHKVIRISKIKKTLQQQTNLVLLALIGTKEKINGFHKYLLTTKKYILVILILKKMLH